MFADLTTWCAALHSCCCRVLLQDAARPATVDNLVLLTHAEADEHDERHVSGGGLQALRVQVGGSLACKYEMQVASVKALEMS